MIVSNSNKSTAIAIKRTSKAVVLVVMCSGKLKTRYIKPSVFKKSWTELTYSLDEAIEKFLKHAKEVGSTKAALNALNKVKKAQQHSSLRLF